MAIFDQSTLGSPDNQITFNNPDGDPYFRLTSRLPVKRQIKEFEAQLPQGMGIADFESFIGRTFYTLGGKMYPSSEDSYDDGRRQLRKLSSLTVEQDDPQSDDGYVPYQWQETIPKQIFMKIQYVDIPENSSTGLKQQFNLFAKIRYPAIFSQVAKTYNLNSTGVNQLGGATIPAQIPMRIPTTLGGGAAMPFTLPVTLGAQSAIRSQTIINEGDIATYPSFQIYGPCSLPRITNRTTGEFIELQISLPTSSDTAIIDYGPDSISITAQNQDAYGKLTTGSTLFKIKPGQNDIIFSGSSVGTGSNVTLIFFDAWPLS